MPNGKAPDTKPEVKPEPVVVDSTMDPRQPIPASVGNKVPKV